MSILLKRRLKQAAALTSAPFHHPKVGVDIVGALSRGAFDRALHIARTTTLAQDFGAEKIISRQYRYLWICNPKVASRSIIRALCSADPDAEIIKNKSVSQIYALYPEVRDYFSFAFIRHPFDRALSLYSEIHFSPERYQEAQSQHKKEKRQKFFDQCYGLEDAGSFDEYCQWLNTPYGSDMFADPHFRSQHLMIRLADGRLPDFIGHMESIDEGLRQAAEMVGMPAPELPMLNTMAGWQSSSDALNAARTAMRAHLTARSRELLLERYATDMELGGYSPD